MARLPGLARLEKAVVGNFAGSIYSSGCGDSGGLVIEGHVWFRSTDTLVSR